MAEAPIFHLRGMGNADPAWHESPANQRWGAGARAHRPDVLRKTARPGPVAAYAILATLVLTTGCGSNLGSDHKSAGSSSPIPVLESSYLNAKSTNLGPQAIPGIVYGNVAHAFADFFQTGRYGLFVATVGYNPNNPATFGDLGQLQFFESDGVSWIDHTSSLLSDTTGCTLARKAVVADFSGDGKPGVFVACTGLDEPPFSGEAPLLRLSQPNGRYGASELPITGYFHSASAAELNAHGYADIVVTDTSVADTPYLLRNNHDGSFTADLTTIPAAAVSNRQIYEVEWIDVDGVGRFDLFLSETEPGSQGDPDPCPGCNFGPTIFKNNGSNQFLEGSAVGLPAVPAYGQAIDIIYRGGKIYLLRTINLQGPNFYNATVVQRIAYPALTSEIIYSYSGPYPGAGAWVEWIVPYNNLIVADDVAFPLSIVP